MTKYEALTMAIEALNKLARLGSGDSYGNSDGNCIAIKTLKAIEEALDTEQVREDLPEQEPVAWGNPKYNYAVHHEVKPAWQELTDDELSKLFAKCGWVEEGNNLHTLGFYKHARMLEQALKEKNT